MSVVSPSPVPFPPERAFVFRLNDHGQGPELLRQVFLERGWQEYDEDEQEEWDWNLWWRTSRFRNCDYDTLFPWQRLNHYPKSTAITKKDSLARNLKRMKGVYGSSAYNFSPTAFNLPNDYTKFVGQYGKAKEKQQYWICKPADLSRGRGIFLFRELSELQYDCNAVVQEYIPNPMLISGYKFDLRVYVSVLSFQPLTAYIYEEGLVRFSTEKFDLTELRNMFAHLTNTSINKHGPAYSMDKERVGPGCKWTLTQLRHYFRTTLHLDDTHLFGRIINIVVLTLIVQAAQVPKATNCFELYGFDILVDDQQKPWLLEVNFSPALTSDCAIDVTVKKPMLHDLADMLGFTDRDLQRGAGATVTMGTRPPRAPAHALAPGTKRLPDLQRVKGHQRRHRTSTTTGSPSLAPSSSTCSTVSWQDSMVAEDEVVPIVPGCGLPSVQQPAQSQEDFFPQTYPRIPAIRPRSNRGKVGRPGSRQLIKERNGSKVENVKDDENEAHKKRDSKVSEYSDSGISSFSGSSDASDSLSDESKTRVDAGEGGTPAGKDDGRRGSGDKSQNSAKTVLSTQKTRRRTLAQLTPTKGAITDTNNSNNCPPPPPSRGRQTTQLSLSRPAPLLHPSSSKHSSPVNQSQRSRLTAYAKPWRGHHSEHGGHHGNNKLPPATPPKPRVGQFYLAFPFNEATRRNMADPRAIIRECVKQLKERGGERRDGEMLWAPLKPESGVSGAAMSAAGH